MEVMRALTLVKAKQPCVLHVRRRKVQVNQTDIIDLTCDLEIRKIAKGREARTNNYC